MTMVKSLLLATALCAGAGANAAEQKPPQKIEYPEYQMLHAEQMTTRQLVKRAKEVTSDTFAGASASVRVDEHDLVVEFRVSEGDEKLRDSITAYINTVAELGEQGKQMREMIFTPGTLCTVPSVDEDHERVLVACRFYKPMPMSAARPASSKLSNKK